MTKESFDQFQRAYVGNRDKVTEDVKASINSHVTNIINRMENERQTMYTQIDNACQPTDSFYSYNTYQQELLTLQNILDTLATGIQATNDNSWETMANICHVIDMTYENEVDKPIPQWDESQFVAFYCPAPLPSHVLGSLELSSTSLQAPDVSCTTDSYYAKKLI